MANFQKPKGTLDILPSESGVWLYVEDFIKKQTELYGFKQIRFPTFEATELFCRGVGGSTDIVQKEMYTFIDKDGSSLTLRPEGTACVARSVLENGLYAGAMPIKLYYLSNFFRREKPQAGRSREFWQFGTELYGSDGPEADATVIMLANSIFEKLGLKNVELKINSIGCPKCRPAYRDALKKHFEKNSDELCETCKGRLDTNPLRILDCKSPICKEIAEGAPVTIDFLCDDCKEHFEKLKCLLSGCGIKFEVDTNIVRGLDYYSKTVFEFINESIGAQSTVCGGGRYDGLIEELGGQPLGGVGFGMGLTRLIQSLKDENLLPEDSSFTDVYISPLGERAKSTAFTLVDSLRNKGIIAETDLCSRSLKAQMKYADKTGVRFVMVIGDNEIDNNEAVLQNMKTGDKIKVNLSSDSIMEYVSI
ncbi:MAG: histidine--tRNA ligase [Clostridiales bacterium GWF2_36_10]|nr:MAG: histidine--tRNA ligase [Clostridiales bacterium GWF2_36_10]HAN20566.1 histidine--tRNA ligase [Clostridiales bacterium]